MLNLLILLNQLFAEENDREECCNKKREGQYHSKFKPCFLLSQVQLLKKLRNQTRVSQWHAPKGCVQNVLRKTHLARCRDPHRTLSSPSSSSPKVRGLALTVRGLTLTHTRINTNNKANEIGNPSTSPLIFVRDFAQDDFCARAKIKTAWSSFLTTICERGEGHSKPFVGST